MYGTYGKLSFEGIPRIVFELFVAQRQTAVVLVDFQNLDFDGIADLGEFAGVLDLFGPREIGDVDQTVNTFFQFNEYAEVGEVADFGSVAAAHGVAYFDVCPRILFELLETKAHLAVFAVEGKDNSVDFVANLQEVLSGAEVLAPAHFAYVDETFNAMGHFNKCAVVGHDNNFAVYFVANFEVCVKSVPRMGLELFETESNALFLVIEVENNDVELLVGLDNFAGVAYASP